MPVRDLLAVRRRPSGGVDPFFANVSLLMHCNGTNGSTTFIDNSPNNFALTAQGGAQISTTNPKFGSGSAQFSGTASRVNIPNSPAFDFPNGTDFTVECFLRTTSPDFTIFNGNPVSSGWAWVYDGRRLAFAIRSSVVNLYLLGLSALSDGSWHHIATCRQGVNHRVFFDGSLILSVPDVNSYARPAPLLGEITYNPSQLNIDEFRITKGAARYTANFTPPTAPFPDS